MADPARPPKAFSAWLIAWAWAVSVWATIPLARGLRTWVTEQSPGGRDTFTWMVLGVIALGTIMLTITHGPRLLARRRGGWQILGVVTVLAFYAWETLQLQRSAPEEAMHFLQYGVLYLLAVRAVGASFPYSPALLAAWLFCSFCGMVDEFLQWLTPGRTFDFRDIGLNSESAGLMALLVVLALRPAWLRQGGWRGPAIRPVTTWGLAATVMLGLLVSNHPRSVERWTGWWGIPESVVRGWGEMVEYGYAYQDPHIGRFQSRLRSAEWAEQDRLRGAEMAAEVAGYRGQFATEGYADYLERYPASVDPYAHEVRVHLYARDRNLEKRVNLRRAWRIHVGGEDPSELPVGPHTAPATEVNAGRYIDQTATALHEHRLLHRYYPVFMAHYPESKDARWEAALEAEIPSDYAFHSQVSRSLITGWRPRHFLLLLGFLAAGLVGLRRYLASSSSNYS